MQRFCSVFHQILKLVSRTEFQQVVDLHGSDRRSKGLQYVVAGTGSYQYDAMGNMTSLHVGSRSLSFAYAGTTPRIQSVSGTNPETVAYDNAGNDVTVGRYSLRNLLEHIGNGDPRMEPGPSLDYFYDGRGVRIVTSLTTPGMPPWGGTKTRRSVYSPELHLLSQSAWSGEDVELGERTGRSSNLAARTRSPRAVLTLAVIRPATAIPIGGSSVGTDYVWFADQPVAQAFTDPSQPARYTFTDHLGTPILQTDATAAVVWRVEYEPYGTIYTYRTGDANDPQALRLPGQEAPESLNTAGYNIFRWYRAEWGRYTQRDPVGLQAGTNLYAYVWNSPVGFIDPLGLITSLEAISHYGEGSGSALNENFSDIDTSGVTASTFKQVRSLLAKAAAGKKNGCCLPSTTSIDSTSGYSVPGIDNWLVFGDITLHLKGSLTMNKSCCWTLNGQLSAFPDIYDFNKRPGRSALGATLTWVGSKIQGTAYTIYINGVKPLSDSGCLK